MSGASQRWLGFVRRQPYLGELVQSRVGRERCMGPVSISLLVRFLASIAGLSFHISSSPFAGQQSVRARGAGGEDGEQPYLSCKSSMERPVGRYTSRLGCFGSSVADSGCETDVDRRLQRCYAFGTTRVLKSTQTFTAIDRRRGGPQFLEAVQIISALGGLFILAG